MSLSLPKFIFSITVLNIAAMAQNSDNMNNFYRFAKSIENAFSKNLSTEIIFILIATIITLIIMVVLYEIRRSGKARREIVNLAWIKFDYRAEHLKLGTNSIDLLKEIIRESDLQDPNSIMKSPSIFEKSLEKFYEKRNKSISDEKYASIRDLRQSLGFLPLSKDMAYTSTRQFAGGEKCLVQIPDSGRATNKGMCSILDTEEKHWSIARPEGPRVLIGTWARITLNRTGDAEYVFRVQVLSDSDNELILSHTNKLNRAQQRNWVRIDVSIPVEVIQMVSNHVNDIFAGKIIDMSGGGLGMILPVKLVNGSKLKLNFDIPGQGPVNNLPVKVVRVTENNLHSVAFEGDVHLIQEQIIQYVFEKQRQDSGKANQ